MDKTVCGNNTIRFVFPIPADDRINDYNNYHCGRLNRMLEIYFKKFQHIGC